jgi:alpha-glucosidase
VLAHAPLGRPALYARANAAIPLWPALMHTREVPDVLTLRVFVAGDAMVERELFEDAGDGFGPVARRTVAVEPGRDELTVRISARAGDYVPPRERIELELIGLAAPAAVSADEWRFEDGAVVVELPERAEATEVVVRARR